MLKRAVISTRNTLTVTKVIIRTPGHILSYHKKSVTFEKPGINLLATLHYNYVIKYSNEEDHE
jgi:hypothetical protein